MRIALISPRGSFLGRSPAFREFFANSRELEFYRQYWSGLGSGLLVIASLTPPEHELELIDENVDGIDFDKKYDLIAITAMTHQATRAYEIARLFRERNIPVIIGGIHATVLPEEACQHADSVVIGEAENVWKQVLNDFSGRRLMPRYHSDHQVDLTRLPVPRYDLLKSKPYNMVWIQTSRGCPHDCGFCCASRVYGKSYRHKTVEQVMDEIRAVQQVHPHTLIGFADDNLFSDRKYAYGLLDALGEVKVNWIGQSDISIAKDQSLLKSIREGGCVALLTGFESINESNLRGLDSSNWKMNRIKDYRESIQSIQGAGIGLIGTFIIGFDNDDTSVFDKLTDFIIKNHLAGAQIAALTPFPNTKIAERLASEDRILDTPWENYTLYDVNIKPKNMSSHQLEAGIVDTFKRVYAPSVARDKAKYFQQIFYALRKERI